MDKAALEAEQAVAKAALAKDAPLPGPKPLNHLAVAQAELADFLALQLTQARSESLPGTVAAVLVAQSALARGFFGLGFTLGFGHSGSSERTGSRFLWFRVLGLWGSAVLVAQNALARGFFGLGIRTLGLG